MTKSLLQQSKGFDNYNNKQFIEKNLLFKLNINEISMYTKGRTSKDLQRSLTKETSNIEVIFPHRVSASK